MAASGARELARRLRQPRLAADEAGPLGGEADLEIGLARDRAQAAGDRALERLGRVLAGRRLGFDVRGHMLSPLAPFTPAKRPLTRSILAALELTTLSRKGRGWPSAWID